MRTVAVIGAGPHGLSATKAALQHGFEATCFERSDDLGGNWNFGGQTSRVYRSTHVISSKPFTQFPDFPMPDSYPDYPSHWQVHAYFRRYAEHFGLLEHIRFNTEVVRAEPLEGNRWAITTRRACQDGAAQDGPAQDGAAQEVTEEFDALVVANGHNWFPKIPQYPGQDGFTGKILHSADYKEPDVLRGKRVMVVGAGNTGCDVAVESAQNATATFHSTRRGYWYAPKYAFGRPGDQTADLLLAMKLPLWLRRQLLKSTLRLTVGDYTKFGLRKPDHKFFETHPVVNQQLVYYVGHGDIVPKPDIERFDGSTVRFSDATSAEIDVIVFCTGYLAKFPFLDADLLNWQGDHPRLARQIFTPRHETLLVSGLIQPDSGQWNLAHWQGMAIAKYLAARRDDPATAQRFLEAVLRETEASYSGGVDYAESSRHYYEVAHHHYIKVLEDTVRAFERGAVPGVGQRAAGPVQSLAAR